MYKQYEPTINKINIIKINLNVTNQYGGKIGLLNQTLISSAIGRIQNGYYTSYLQVAVALFESLIQGHPFLDGNKRTAFMAFISYLYSKNIIINEEQTRLGIDIIKLIKNKQFNFQTIYSYFFPLQEISLTRNTNLNNFWDAYLKLKDKYIILNKILAQ